VSDIDNLNQLWNLTDQHFLGFDACITGKFN
jgi:hypothetical protein